MIIDCCIKLGLNIFFLFLGRTLLKPMGLYWNKWNTIFETQKNLKGHTPACAAFCKLKLLLMIRIHMVGTSSLCNTD